MRAMDSLRRLIDRLNEETDDWTEHGDTPVEAAVNLGILDESDLASMEFPELDFSTEAQWRRLSNYDGDEFDD